MWHGGYQDQARSRWSKSASSELLWIYAVIAASTAPSQSLRMLLGWVGSLIMSQTTGNTFKNITGNNLEIISKEFFFRHVIEMYAFLESRRKESLKLNVLLNRPFLTLIKEEAFEGSVFQFLYHVAAKSGVCQAGILDSFKKSKNES